MEAYHEKQNVADDTDVIFLCNECDDEFLTKSELDVHIKNLHPIVIDFDCEKCDYVGTSIANLKHHREGSHFQFKYYCAACNFATTNKDLLKSNNRTIKEKGDQN